MTKETRFIFTEDDINNGLEWLNDMVDKEEAMFFGDEDCEEKRIPLWYQIVGARKVLRAMGLRMARDPENHSHFIVECAIAQPKEG